MMNIYRYTAVRAKQADGRDVFAFAANPRDVLSFAAIDGIKRKDDGSLDGFQRHQIAAHIKEIRAYLQRQDALLPNAVVVAFIDGVTIRPISDGVVEVEIRVDENNRPGFVVDGQQRLTALSGIDRPEFQVFVSALICEDYNELRQQFVLINNARPLPKALIYELLPNIDGLPERFTKRAFAARMVDRLNYGQDSVLRGRIHQHTNAKGKISDLALQQLVMNSVSQGAINDFLAKDDCFDKSYELINQFFRAVEEVFPDAWIGMNSKTSRLVHGAGIVAMGFVMESIYLRVGRVDRQAFAQYLTLLTSYTAWTSGYWTFSADDRRPWNGIQNTPTDISLLSNYLVQGLQRELRTNNNSLPELELADL